jgi:hypothetical protein
MADWRPCTATKRTGPTESVERVRPDEGSVVGGVCGHAGELAKEVESAAHTTRRIRIFIAFEKGR